MTPEVEAEDDGRALVLIVEDNHELRRFLREVLEGEFRVATAPDGRQGLEAARRLRPDLVVTNVTMPEMSGEQAAAARHLAAVRLADPNPDCDMSRGLSFAFLIKALARHAVTAWDGIGDAGSKPLPLSPEVVECLMDLDDIAAF